MARKRNPLSLDIVMELTKASLARDKDIPRFSKKHATITDYLKSPEFKNAKPAYQQRVLKQALEHPKWTLAEARGHSKPTGNRWQVSNDQGLLSDPVVWKNRKEESYYASYLNDLKAVMAGNLEYTEFNNKWKGKTFTDIKGNKHQAITEKDTIIRLADFNELPTGPDVYLKKGA
ncbi:hypothetical protein [Desulfotruncus arcticus]|uniref:hypothetical protein n=1 Tax=Desulfotruncus arcticus TaxID=341036 RepID=UPI000B85BE69|nr:hypothetical protein [Desulfotruncus arcticus]